MARTSYPGNAPIDFTDAKQAPPSQATTSRGTIGKNPNSTGGHEMQSIRDDRAGEFEMKGYSYPVTDYGDDYRKDEYVTYGMIQQTSDPLLMDTDGDRE